MRQLQCAEATQCGTALLAVVENGPQAFTRSVVLLTQTCLIVLLLDGLVDFQM
jgi:hypothetical protein